jgi:Ca2+-binding RTX toxin-like protein
MSFLRWFRRQMKRRSEAAAKRRRKVLFEPLEPRLLLSSDPLSYTAAAGTAADMTLRLQDVEGIETLELINNSAAPGAEVVVSQALSDTSEVVITGADQDDKLTVDFSTPFSVPDGITFTDSSPGDSDTLEVIGTANEWNIIGSNEGNVGGAEFMGIENLTGGADTDTYVFEGGGSIDGVIDGGEGADTLAGADAANTWELTDTNAGALNGQAFAGIENLTGGSGNDTIVGPDVDTTWIIDGTNAGSIGGVSFTGFENLTGGAGEDTFVFADGGSISGVIDGGGGTNTLDYSAYTADVTVDLEAGTATGTGGVSNIQNVTGGEGSDTLAGDSAANILIGGAGDDMLTGGAGADTVDGGAGSDTLTEQRDADFTLRDTDLTIGLEGMDILAGIEQADFTAGVSANTLDASAFTGFVTLAGQEGDDILIAGLGIGTFDGGTGSDKLVGQDTANTWNIMAENAGTLNDDTFSSIEKLIGGAMADTFILAAAAMVTGLIDGRLGDDRLVGGDIANTWKITGANAGKLNDKTFVDIENLTGGSGEDTLLGLAADSTWNITGEDSGKVAGVAFSGFENLTGAADNKDTFIFAEGGSLSGLLDGGAGGLDTLVLDGGIFNTVVYTATGPDSGTIDRDGDVITYAGLEPITDNSGVADRILELSVWSDTATLVDNFDGTMTLSTNSGIIPTFESITFDDPTSSLTINLGGDEDIPFLSKDVLTINSFDVAGVDLIVNGEDGTDEVEIVGAVNADDVTINAEQITIDSGAAIVTTGNVSLTATAADVTTVTDVSDLVDRTASITVKGEITAGNITMTSEVERDVDVFDVLPITLSATSLASVTVNGADITTASLVISAKTFGSVVSESAISVENQFAESATATIVNSSSSINVVSLELSASTETSYSARGISTLNSVTGDVEASVENSTVMASAGGITISATDLAELIAEATEQIFDVDVAVPAAVDVVAARNELTRNVDAFLSNSTATATDGNIDITATKHAQLSAKAETVTLTGSVLPYAVSIGGTYASNTLLGSTKAYVEEGSDLETVNTGDVLVTADDTSGIDARSGASATADSPDILLSGGVITVGASIAFNAIGWDAGPGLQTLDALLGLGLGTDARAEVLAYVTDSTVNSADDVHLTATGAAQINATVSNAAESIADSAYGSFGSASGAILASNKLNTGTRAYITDEDGLDGFATAVDAIRDVMVQATDQAGIFANAKVVSSSITTSDGGASVLDGAVGFLTPAVYDSDVGGTVNLVFGDTVRVVDGFAVDGTPGSVYEYLGNATSGFNIDLAAQDYTDLDFWKEVLETQLIPTGNNLSPSDSVTVGGLVVRNEVDAEVAASISDAEVTTITGDVDLQASETAEIRATADSSATSSGGSAFGTGTSMAINGVIATNIVLSSAEVTVETSTVDSGAAIRLAARNDSTIDAHVMSATSSGAEAVGVVLAFNTIGYESQNILFSTLDALLGTDIGTQRPATALASILNSDITAAGDLSLEAESAATLDARVDTAATSAAAAFFGASGIGANGVLASNMVSSHAAAYIDNQFAAPGDTVFVGGDVSISSSDEATINAVTELVTTSKATNDLGIGILNNLASTLLDDYQFTTNSGMQPIVFGDTVRVASGYGGGGTPGTVYRYMGQAASFNLGGQDYSDFGFWQELDETNVIPTGIVKGAMTAFGIKGGTSKSFYAVVARNDVDSAVESFIDDAVVTADGNISLKAVQGASLRARDDSVVSAGSGSKGGVIATNQVLSKANAYITDSIVTTALGGGGSIVLEAENVSQIDATTTTSASGVESIAFVAAFNAIGWNTSNILFNALTALLGTDLLIEERPAEVQAYIKNSDVSADGDLSLTADSVKDLFNLTGLTADDLDDAGTMDKDDEVSPADEAADDAAADEALLASLKSEFESNGIALSDAFVFTIGAVNELWFVDDGEGRVYSIVKNPDDSLTVALTTLLHAQVGNEVTSNARNDRVLVDAAVAATKPENKGKAFKQLKYGSNGMAAGGILASNRVSSFAKAYIDFEPFDHTTSETVDELRHGDRISLDSNVGGGTAGEIYKYVGPDQIVETAFDFSSRTEPNELRAGERVKLHDDIGGGTAGEIYEYQGPDILDPGDVLDPIDLTAQDYTSGAWVLVNGPISIDLGSENYAGPDWELVNFTPAGTIVAGGDISLRAEDTAGIKATSDLAISSAVSNNLDAFVQLAENVSQKDYDYTTKSGSKTLVTGDRTRLAGDFVQPALQGVVFEYVALVPALIDLNSLTAADLEGAGPQTSSADWERITGNADIADVFPNVGNLAESNSRATGGMVILNDVRSEVLSYITNADVDADGNVSLEAFERATLQSDATSNVSSSGGSAWGTGDSVAINGQIVTNLVLSKANAYLVDSNITTTDAGSIGVGDISLDARNASVLDATLNSTTDTGDTAFGVALAFNSMGWESQNILFNAVDALLGTDLFGREQPAEALAYIVDTPIDAAGSVSVTAADKAQLNATVSNAANSAASALFNAGGKSIGGILASNKVSSQALAYIDFTGARGTVMADGGVTVKARDDAGIFANSKLVSS